MTKNGGLGWNSREGWRWASPGYRDGFQIDKSGPTQGEQPGSVPTVLDGDIPEWNPWAMLSEVFRQKTKDALEVCRSWAGRVPEKYDYRLNLAASIAVDWALKKRKVDGIDVANKPPNWVKVGVCNALRDADRMGLGDDYDLWDQLPAGSDCPMCNGNGWDRGAYCENCDGTGELTGKPGTSVWTKVRRVESTDPNPATINDGEVQIGEAQTVLSAPDSRYVNQPMAESQGSEDDTSAHLAAMVQKYIEMMAPKTAEAYARVKVDGWTIREAAEEYGLTKSTLDRRVKTIDEIFALQIEILERQGEKFYARKALHRRPADTGCSSEGDPCLNGDGGFLRGRIARDSDDVLIQAKHKPDILRKRYAGTCEVRPGTFISTAVVSPVQTVSCKIAEGGGQRSFEGYRAYREGEYCRTQVWEGTCEARQRVIYPARESIQVNP